MALMVMDGAISLILNQPNLTEAGGVSCFLSKKLMQIAWIGKFRP